MSTRYPAYNLPKPLPLGYSPVFKSTMPNKTYTQFHQAHKHHLANYSVTEPEKKQDIFRDTILRYAGYANELGVAFKDHISSKAFIGSYVVATLYALADGITKAKKSYEECKENHYDHNHPLLSAVITAIDVTFFHILGTIVVPAYIIEKIREFTVHKVPKSLAKTFRGKALPVIVSLGAIPLLVKPLDHMVNATLDYLLRMQFDRPTEVVNKKATDVIGPLKLKPSKRFYETAPLRQPKLYSAFQ